jgi:transposase InsO family protein
MCRILEVSPSAYYAWRNDPDSSRKRKNLKLITHIRAIHEESKHTYGSPRMHTELRSRGVRCSENRVARLMREQRIQAKHKRKFKATTDSNHKLAVHENILNRSFDVKAPNRVWACDITYIYTREGWLDGRCRKG